MKSTEGPSGGLSFSGVTMKVRITSGCYVEGKPYKAGDVVETNKGQLLIGMRKAVPVTDDEPEVVDTPDGDDIPTLDEEPEVLVSDSVRELAILHGVDLAEVQGTGQNGRIKKSDVEAVIAARDDESESLTTR